MSATDDGRRAAFAAAKAAKKDVEMLMKAMMGGLAWERETKDLNTVLSTTCSP
jgi:hypothetical protein